MEAPEDDTASEETGSEVRDDQTDTSSAEVPSARPRRAVTLRNSSEAVKRPPVERPRRVRPGPTTTSAVEGEKAPPARPEEPEVSKLRESWFLFKNVEWSCGCCSGKPLSNIRNDRRCSVKIPKSENKRVIFNLWVERARKHQKDVPRVGIASSFLGNFNTPELPIRWMERVRSCSCGSHSAISTFPISTVDFCSSLSSVGHLSISLVHYISILDTP